MRLVLLPILALVLAAQELPPGRGGNTREFLGLGPPPDAAAAARGEKLYSSNCAFCHGDKARGAEGPNLVRSETVLHDEKAETIGPAVSKGFPEKGMPAFPTFTPAQLYDLAQYLHLQVELVANRGLYKRLNVVSGNAAAGKQYFEGAGGCAGCHSATGDLAHIAARYAPDQLQNRFIWPGTPRTPKVTVTTPSGESISGTLKRISDVDISMLDSSGAYHSWPAQSVKVQIEDRLAAHRRLLDQYTDTDIHNVTAYLVTLK